MCYWHLLAIFMNRGQVGLARGRGVSLYDRTFHGYGTILLKVILPSLWFQRSTVALCSSTFLKEKNGKNVSAC